MRRFLNNWMATMLVFGGIILAFAAVVGLYALIIFVAGPLVALLATAFLIGTALAAADL